MLMTRILRHRSPVFAVAIASTFALASQAGLAAIGTPLGPEFRVPSRPSEDGFPFESHVAVVADGRQVVTWSALSRNDVGGGRSYNIFGRVFAADGTPLGAEFKVNDRDANAEGSPKVVTAPDGGFTVAWIDNGPGFRNRSIQARRFAPDGAPRGLQFPVSAAVSPDAVLSSLSLASNRGGAIVVVWESAIFSGLPNDAARSWTTSFHARQIDSSGRVGPTERIIGGRTGFDLQPIPVVATPALSTGSAGPAVAMDDAGDFVVAWAGSTSAGVIGGLYGAIPGTGATVRSVLFRRVTAAGRADPLPTVVERVVLPDRYDRAGDVANDVQPAVAMEPDGDFAIAYRSGEAPQALVARRYSALGRPLGDALPVSPFGRSIGLALTATGQMTVTWDGQSPQTPADGIDVFARVFGADDTPLTAALRVNATVAGEQSAPSLAVDASGDFTVTWTTIIPSGSPGLFMPDVLARRYRGH